VYSLEGRFCILSQDEMLHHRVSSRAFLLPVLCTWVVLVKTQAHHGIIEEKKWPFVTQDEIEDIYT